MKQNFCAPYLGELYQLNIIVSSAKSKLFFILGVTFSLAKTCTRHTLNKRIQWIELHYFSPCMWWFSLMKLSSQQRSRGHIRCSCDSLIFRPFRHCGVFGWSEGQLLLHRGECSSASRAYCHWRNHRVFHCKFCLWPLQLLLIPLQWQKFSFKSGSGAGSNKNSRR